MRELRGRQVAQMLKRKVSQVGLLCSEEGSKEIACSHLQLWLTGEGEEREGRRSGGGWEGKEEGKRRGKRRGRRGERRGSRGKRGKRRVRVRMGCRKI